MLHAQHDAVAEIAAGCLAVRARMLSRAVSALYDRTMGGHGVTISQVNIMVLVGRTGPCTPGEVGKRLEMERSTVSRSIRPLLERGWLEGESSDAGRVRRVRLTPRGIKKLQSVLPDWRSAQAAAADMLGSAGTSALRQLGDRLWSRQSSDHA